MFSYSLKGFSEPAYKNCLCKLTPQIYPIIPKPLSSLFWMPWNFFRIHKLEDEKRLYSKFLVLFWKKNRWPKIQRLLYFRENSPWRYRPNKGYVPFFFLYSWYVIHWYGLFEEIRLEERNHHVPEQKDGVATHRQVGKVYGKYHRQIRWEYGYPISLTDNH